MTVEYNPPKYQIVTDNVDFYIQIETDWYTPAVPGLKRSWWAKTILRLEDVPRTPSKTEPRWEYVNAELQSGRGVYGYYDSGSKGRMNYRSAPPRFSYCFCKEAQARIDGWLKSYETWYSVEKNRIDTPVVVTCSKEESK